MGLVIKLHDKDILYKPKSWEGDYSYWTQQPLSFLEGGVDIQRKTHPLWCQWYFFWFDLDHEPRCADLVVLHYGPPVQHAAWQVAPYVSWVDPPLRQGLGVKPEEKIQSDLMPSEYCMSLIDRHWKVCSMRGDTRPCNGDEGGDHAVEAEHRHHQQQL